MSTLLDDRYALSEIPPVRRLTPAYDDLLQQPVALVLLEAPSDGVARQRLLRRLRAVARAREQHVAPLLDSGSWRDLLFLVVPVSGHGTLANVLPLPVQHVVAVLLHVLDGLTPLRERDLAPVGLEPEQVPLSEQGLVQVVPGGDRDADGAGPDPLPEVAAAGALLGQLLQGLPDGSRDPRAASLHDLAARCLGRKGSPVLDLQGLREELLAWQRSGGVLRSSVPAGAPGEGIPPAAGAAAPPAAAVAGNGSAPDPLASTAPAPAPITPAPITPAPPAGPAPAAAATVSSGATVPQQPQQPQQPPEPPEPPEPPDPLSDETIVLPRIADPVRAEAGPVGAVDPVAVDTAAVDTAAVDAAAIDTVVADPVPVDPVAVDPVPGDPGTEARPDVVAPEADPSATQYVPVSELFHDEPDDGEPQQATQQFPPQPTPQPPRPAPRHSATASRLRRWFEG